MTKMIGICGGSGSGKTTLANLMVKSNPNVYTLVSMDDYYLPINQQAKDTEGKINFDLPSALDNDLLKSDLLNLKQGIGISKREYNFNNPKKGENIKLQEPKENIVCEGIFLLSDPSLRDLFDAIVFVEAEYSVMYNRRLKRDMEHRNIAEKMVAYQWENHFMPAFKRYVLPYKECATFIVNGNEPFIMEQILKKLTSI